MADCQQKTKTNLSMRGCTHSNCDQWADALMRCLVAVSTSQVRVAVLEPPSIEWVIRPWVPPGHGCSNIANKLGLTSSLGVARLGVDSLAIHTWLMKAALFLCIPCKRWTSGAYYWVVRCVWYVEELNGKQLCIPRKQCAAGVHSFGRMFRKNHCIWQVA